MLPHCQAKGYCNQSPESYRLCDRCVPEAELRTALTRELAAPQSGIGLNVLLVLIPIQASIIVEGLDYLRRYASNNRVGCHIFRDDGVRSDNRVFADGYSWHN